MAKKKPITLPKKTLLTLKAMNKENIQFAIEPPGVEAYIIGRSDDQTNYEPDIDLAPADARNLGVSRRHACLVRYKGKTHLIDLSSVNGSFLNNEQLIPKTPYTINRGDEIRIGNLALQLI